MVQLAEASHARSHQAPRVDDDPHRLAAFNLINAADELSAPCRRSPANVTILVPLPIFAQAFKLAADAAHSGAAFFDGDLTASKQKNGVAFRVLQIRINSHALRYGSPNPSLRDAQDALITHITITQLYISPLHGTDSIPHSRFGSGCCFDRESRRLIPQLHGNRVDHCRQNSLVRGIDKGEVKIGWNRQRHRRAPRPSYPELRRIRQLRQITEPSQNHETIPSKQSVDKSQIDECRNNP